MAVTLETLAVGTHPIGPRWTEPSCPLSYGVSPGHAYGGNMTGYDKTTALIVVDLQNDFADPSGSLYVDGGEEVVASSNREIIGAVSAGACVVYTQDWHPASTPHFQKDGGDWPVHCVMGTWGAELHPRLVVVGPIVRKGSSGEDGYSGFFMRDPETGEEKPTALKELLDDRGIEKTVIVGLALDVCVRATSLDAVEHGFDTTLVREASAPVEMEQGDGDRAVEEMREAGISIE